MSEAVLNRPSSFVEHLRHWVAGLILLLLVLAGTLLIVRDAAGITAASISTPMAVTAVIAATALVNLARGFLNRDTVFARWLIPACVLIGVTLLIARHVQPSSLVWVWSIAVGAELLAAIWLFRPRLESARGHVERPSMALSSPTAAADMTESNEVLSQVEDVSLELDAEDNANIEANVTQQITRSMTSDGESITGRVRVDFAQGEQLKPAHLAFTPPLQNLPELYVDQLGGPAAAVTPGSVYAHGARIDVRLEQAAIEATSIWFEIYVVAPSNAEPS